MPKTTFTFPKEEKLCSKKHIDLLFEKGTKAFAHPFSASYLLFSEEDKNQLLATNQLPPHPKVLIVVPKKIFKKAHDRNKVKRLIREAYRLERNKLLSYLYSADDGISANFIQFFSLRFVGKQIPSLNYLQEKLHQLFQKIKAQNSTPL